MMCSLAGLAPAADPREVGRFRREDRAERIGGGVAHERGMAGQDLVQRAGSFPHPEPDSRPRPRPFPDPFVWPA